jgi:geranylgeranyl pyrophosphate synthase/predicted secreted hydrolase
VTHDTRSAPAPAAPLPAPRADAATAPFGTPHPEADMEAWCLSGDLHSESGGAYRWAAALFREGHGCGSGTGPGYGLLFTCSGPEGSVCGSWLSPDLVETIRASVRGDEAMDPRVRSALTDVLAEGVPLPDRLLKGEVADCAERLDLVLGEQAALRAEDDGSFLFTVRGEVELELRLTPQKPAVPQFDLHGHYPGPRPDGSDATTSYFIPRLRSSGRVRTQASTWECVEGRSWLENDWGGSVRRSSRAQGIADRAWLWSGMQLDNGWDITVIRAQHTDPVTAESTPLFTRATAVAPDGSVSYHHDLTWQATQHWTSLASLESYPTTAVLSIPGLGLDVVVAGTAADHEIRTVLNGRAFCEAPATVCGTMNGTRVSGNAFMETLPSGTVGDVEGYMRRISQISISEAAAVYPASPDVASLHALTGADTSPSLDDTLDRLHQSLIAPLRHLLDNPGRSWRPYITGAVFCLLGVDPEPYRPLTAVSELLHTASAVIDDIEDASLLRRGRPAVHHRFGIPTAINAGTLAYLTFDPILERIPQHDGATMLRVHRLCLQALRTGHTGQALDLTGPRSAFEDAVATGSHHQLLSQVHTAHRLKTGVPVRCMAEAAAVLAGASEEQITALGRYFEAVGTAYQISDDVAGLDGVTSAEDRKQGRSSKTPAEDLLNGRITYPVAHATGLLDHDDRHRLRDSLYQQSPDGAARAAELLTRSGALQACLDDGRTLVDEAWKPLNDLLPPSQHKALVRALGWYAAQRQTDPAAKGPGTVAVTAAHQN